MGNIRDISDLISKSTSGSNGDPELIFFSKNPRIALNTAAGAPVAGRPVSFWRYYGSPEQGPIPSTGEILYSSSIGAIKFTSAIAGFERNLTQFNFVNHTTNYGTLILYDRLYHIGGLAANSTAVQTIQNNPASPAITRNVSGEGNFMLAEIYTAIGTTPTNLSAEYINTSGGISSSVLEFFGGPLTGTTNCMFIPFKGRDSGVRSVTKIQLSISTGTAGNFGITIGRPIAIATTSLAGVCGWRDFTTGLPTVPKIDNNACLAFIFISAVAGTPHISGFIHTIQA